MKKYLPLYNYLVNQDVDFLKLNIIEIENVINSKLPLSAIKYREWWSNGGHIQSDAWLEAGWEVISVDLNEHLVEFKKVKLVT